MNLKMMIQGRLVDSVLVDTSKCRDESYLAALKRILKARHAALLLANNNKATFYIEVPSQFIVS